mgnify:CR=1 FL=1
MFDSCSYNLQKIYLEYPQWRAFFKLVLNKGNSESQSINSYRQKYITYEKIHTHHYTQHISIDFQPSIYITH